MESSHDPAPDFVPLSRESVELYHQFWAQMGLATTTAPPMDFLELKEGALEWGERLNLPAGILAKFRQRIGPAQSDGVVFAVMKEFQQLAAAPAPGATAGAANAGTKRKKRRSVTLPMAARAIELVDQGLSNRAIAAELGVSESTVRNHKAVRRARAALKARKADFPSGHKSADGAVEAYDDVDDDGERWSSPVKRS
jgi:hypothetical protein